MEQCFCDCFKFWIPPIQAALLQESFNTTGGPQVGWELDPVKLLHDMQPLVGKCWLTHMLCLEVVNDLMQQQLYGCKAFKGPKPTWKEAAERLIYIAHNMRRIDFASIPSFGDVSAIFNTTYVQKMVIIAPWPGQHCLLVHMGGFGARISGGTIRAFEPCKVLPQGLWVDLRLCLNAQIQPHVCNQITAHCAINRVRDNDMTN